jgi:signal transduction histidine kinase
MRRRKLQLILVHSISALVFILIILYGITQVVFVPDFGFSIDRNGRVSQDGLQFDPPSALQAGDQIIQIDRITWAEYSQHLDLPLVSPGLSGRQVQITYQHGTEVHTIPVVIQSKSFVTIVIIFILIALALAFWVVGLATAVLVRPRDARWWSMIFFCYLTALWISAGSLSSSHLFYSALVMRVAFWLNVPVSWHFHWVFPRPLKRMPLPILIAIYAFGIGMAIFQLLQKLPSDLFFVAFLLAALGSLVLLFLHAYTQPEHRRQLQLLFLAVLIALLPTIAISASGVLHIYPWFSNAAIIFLPIIPGAYFYTIYRQQLGGLEIRANRVVSLLAYGLIGFTLLLVWFSALANSFRIRIIVILVAILTSCLAGVVSILIFPNFQRWFETRVLNIPLPPTNLTDIYSSRILTSLDLPRLIQLLQEEILPSLFVRQSALLRLHSGEAAPLFLFGIDPCQLPPGSEIPDLLDQSGSYRLTSERDLPQSCPWARLILVSKVENQPVSLFLFGKRDPDDTYSPAEIPIFQSLANQTALALLNIEQAERLHSLYQSDIERAEAERIRLSRVLHDDVLNQLAVLKNSIEGEIPPKWEDTYKGVAEHIREVVSNLRPVMLVPYGLRAAMLELVDQFNDANEGQTEIHVDFAPGDFRYPELVELHLYRIAQQAFFNALRHSQAGTIRLKGEFKPEQVFLVVEDNGIGFAAGERLDLTWLLTNKHFGVAGMYERASLINAQLLVNSCDQRGTSVQVTWVAPPDEN